MPTPLELDTLCQKLTGDFGDLIAGSGSTPEARRSNFLSKAIGAFVLVELAGTDFVDAAAACVDGGDDHGIDYLYVGNDHTIWLLQCKFIASGSGEPALGDVSKFCDGVKDLIGGRWDRFNASIRNARASVQRAFDSGQCQINVILTHTGNAISDDRRNLFNDIEVAQNRIQPGMVQCKAFGLTSLHDLHVDSVTEPDIEEIITLNDFGLIERPYRTFYGRMAVQALAELSRQYQERLVARNIRKFKGSTAVNQGIRETLDAEYQHFFYFNNGVTFLCDSVFPLPPRDERASGRFRVRGLSIINGAQTVGAIAEAPAPDYAARPAEVLVTIVSLEGADADFGDKVTQFRNRQNAVDLEDFAALDERQRAWQQALALAGIHYVIKEGDGDPPKSSTCFTLREAAPILACIITGNDWDRFIVAAKSDRRLLYDVPGMTHRRDASSDAYHRVFPDSLTSRKLWRAVQVGRFVQDVLRGRAQGEQGTAPPRAEALPSAEILRHGMWLLLHIAFLRLHLQDAAGQSLSEAELAELSTALDRMAQILVDVVQAQNWNKQARSLFENRTDCRTIKGLVMARLAAP